MNAISFARGSTNNRPVAVSDYYIIEAGGTLKMPEASGVLANDVDLDGDVLTVSWVPQGGNGYLSIESDGGFTYKPHTGYWGVDTYTYQAFDGLELSDPATVTFLVTQPPVVNAPVAVDDAYTTNAGVVLSVPVPGVLDNDTDADDDPLTAHLHTLSSPDVQVSLASSGAFTYTPKPGFAGTAWFTYHAHDGTKNSVYPATVKIVVTDVTPPITRHDAKARYVGPAVILLSPTDNVAVAKTQYSLDGGKTYQPGTKITVATVGSHTLKFFSTDTSGREEAVKTVTFTVWRPIDLKLGADPLKLKTYGATSEVVGIMRANSATGPRLPMRRVYVQRSFTGTSGWTSVATLTTGLDGSARWTARPRKTSYYRLRFAGSSADWLAEAYSNKVKVIPKAALSAPAAVRRGTRLYTLSGTLKPRHKSGTYPVRIYRWRWVDGRWKSYGYVKAKASNYRTYTRYAVKHRFPVRGTWKVRAYHQDSGHGASWSETRKLRVY